MKAFTQMSKTELAQEKEILEKRYKDFQAKGLNLDMSRGKPGADQLDLSAGIFDVTDYTADGMDCRNYGGIDGLPECKKIFADLLGVESKNVIIGGTASLTLMFDYVSQAMFKGVSGNTPWSKLEKVKFLCPVPGYDRHFTICEYFGIEMVNVPMTDNGPDMNIIKEYIQDESVKGMFCVPKYSNPQGITYSDDTVREIAALKPAAKDFRIIWDNAYCVHDLTDDGDVLLNIFNELPKNNNEDMVVEVASTSKITFAGAGVSALIASDNNVAEIKSRLNVQTISHDKMNQHRHVAFFKDSNGVLAHMKKHAVILKPKFQCVLDRLQKELGGKEIATWFNPNGGYFISLDVMNGCASRVGQLCKEAGVVLTTVGATYPYGKDAEDKNIRIAPSFPPVAELELAAELLCICVQIACIEKLITK